MREVALFVEDYAHYQVLKALIQRLVDERGIEITLDWRNVRHGHGAVIREFKQFLRDLGAGRREYPDLVVVATDANCKGLAQRVREITEVTEKTAVRVVCAVPDPHVERWLLIDSLAFKSVFGRGCIAPDQKCERLRYKKLLVDSIRQAGLAPSLGGIEFAADIVEAMDLERAANLDPSLERFLDDMDAVFKGWSEPFPP